GALVCLSVQFGVAFRTEPVVRLDRFAALGTMLLFFASPPTRGTSFLLLGAGPIRHRYRIGGPLEDAPTGRTLHLLAEQPLGDGQFPPALGAIHNRRHGHPLPGTRRTSDSAGPIACWCGGTQDHDEAEQEAQTQADDAEDGGDHAADAAGVG